MKGSAQNKDTKLFPVLVHYRVKKSHKSKKNVGNGGGVLVQQVYIVYFLLRFVDYVLYF